MVMESLSVRERASLTAKCLTAVAIVGAVVMIPVFVVLLFV